MGFKLGTSRGNFASKGEIKTNPVETKKESILKQIIVRTFNILKEIM